MTYDEIIKRLESLILIQELEPNIDIATDLIEDLKTAKAIRKNTIVLDEIGDKEKITKWFGKQ